MTSNRQIPLWRIIQRENIKDTDKLVEFLQLSDEQKIQIEPQPHFPLNLPMRLANKIQKGNLNDPILLQFVPVKTKLTDSFEGFSKDPLNEGCFRKSDTLIHKYKGRVLLILSGACAMHCRYCFRSYFDYKNQTNLDEEIKYIENNSDITEVILSGGDPLSLSDSSLLNTCLRLANIKNITRIRIHTRFPIGIPERITDELINMLQEVGQMIQFWVVIHVNHPIEMDQDVISALKKIQLLGIPILSHSVLLKGVNDSAQVLSQLFSALINNGIMPYYLNKLDKVLGSEKFELETRAGTELIQELNEIMPGYGVPRFVAEIPGSKSKTNLGPAMHMFTSSQQVSNL